MYQDGTKSPEKVANLTNEFYTTIPHNIGRTASMTNLLNNEPDIVQKEELLQVMRDMLNVTVGMDFLGVLFRLFFVESKGVRKSDLDMKYAALKAQIQPLRKDSAEFQEIYNYIINSQTTAPNVKIRNIYSVNRETEVKNFMQDLFNQKLLFHGSKCTLVLFLL